MVLTEGQWQYGSRMAMTMTMVTVWFFVAISSCCRLWLALVVGCVLSTRQEVVLLPYYLNYSVFYGFKKNPQSIVHTEQFGRCLQQWWLLWYRLNVLLICYGLLPLILGVLIFTPKKYEYSLCSLLFLVATSTFLLSQLPSEHTCTSFSYLRLSFVSIFIVFPWCLRCFFPYYWRTKVIYFIAA